MVDRFQSPGVGYMEVVSSQTLLLIIRAHTAPGTTIYPAQWRAYNSMIALPVVATHGVVYHSLHIDPATGILTQMVGIGSTSTERSAMTKIIFLATSLESLQ